MLIVCGPRDEGLCDRFHVSRPLSALSEQTTALVHTCESQLRNLAQKTCTGGKSLSWEVRAVNHLHTSASWHRGCCEAWVCKSANRQKIPPLCRGPREQCED